MKKTITLRELKKMGASKCALHFFKKIFGKKAEIKEVVALLHKLNLKGWEAWLMVQNLRLTKALLSNGADIHDAAQRAIWEGHLKIAKYLVKNGADIHPWDKEALLG